ncbi:unnamed protein product, partial [Cladocopium goreaui]
VLWQLWRRCGGNVAAMAANVAAMWRRCGGDVGGELRHCRQLPPHCRHIAATLPPHCRHLAATAATGPYFCQ